MNLIAGFSKLSKEEKVDLIIKRFFHSSISTKEKLKAFWHPDPRQQALFDEFSENSLTNFFSPYGVVPNMKINDEIFCVPMVTEESSVVAAASKTAKFWSNRGGFKSQVLSQEKIGQVHFIYKGDKNKLFGIFKRKKNQLLNAVHQITSNMKKRGGGIISLNLLDKRCVEPDYYQIFVTFHTCDAMGANFINSVLETLGNQFTSMVQKEILGTKESIQTIMCILSNYTPKCLVRTEVSCTIEALDDPSHEMDAASFAHKFNMAARIAEVDVYRATTHNKGIFNGIDAVVLATGNDFRAAEACGHAYAAREGRYKGLTRCRLYNGVFRYELTIPLSLGTVGGLTNLHPMAEFSLKLLGYPTATKLMEIVSAIGLAQNFAAIRSLITVGIQRGHMKMHLFNILNHLEANEEEKIRIKKAFSNRTISFNEVREELEKIRHLQ